MEPSAGGRKSTRRGGKSKKNKTKAKAQEKHEPVMEKGNAWSRPTFNANDSAREAQLAAMEIPADDTLMPSLPPNLERSQLHQKCLIWITQVSLHNVPGSDQTLAEKYCEYGVFLSDAKRELAESANQQQRRSQVLAAVYKTALRNNNTKKLNQTQRQHEDNEKAFENTKREADVLNYHLSVYRSHPINQQIQEQARERFVEKPSLNGSGQSEYILKPELDDAIVDFEALLAEEKTYEAMTDEEKAAARMEGKFEQVLLDGNAKFDGMLR